MMIMMMTGPDRLGLPCPTFACISISVCFIHRSHPSYQRQDASPPRQHGPFDPHLPFTVAISFFPLPLNVECQDTHHVTLPSLSPLRSTSQPVASISGFSSQQQRKLASKTTTFPHSSQARTHPFLRRLSM